jgi:hypothetical protein
MGEMTEEEWNQMDTEQRVEACFKHYKGVLLSMQKTHEEINLPDYLAIRTVIGVLQNIRGLDDDDSD